MAGSGTILVACSMGRNVICVDLEDKFVKMMEGNWQKIQQRGPQMGYKMGTARIMQGDSRNLEGLLCDSIITSPPYGEALSGGGIAKYGHYSDPDLANRAYSAENMNIKKQIKRVEEGKAKMQRPDVFTSEGNIGSKGYFEGDYSKNPSNIGNLVYGDINKILKQGNRVFIDCGEAFLDLPSLDSQREGVITTALFSSKIIDKIQHKFSVFFLNLEEWNNLRQELFKVNILSHSIHIDELPTSTVLLSNPVIKLGEIISNPKACLFVTDTDLNTGAKPSILVFPLLQDKETPFAINQACQVSQLNSIHQDKDNTFAGISQLPYGSIDSVITSPPYEGSLEGTSRHTHGGIPARDPRLGQTGAYPYQKRKRDKPSDSFVASQHGLDAEDNIGNLKSTSYLEAMALVYSQCYKVLKSGGLIILVLKNFIRDKKEIRLDLDSIKLCEQAEFTLEERHYRKLSAQSFWRIQYHRKYPDAPVLDREDVLVFRK